MIHILIQILVFQALFLAIYDLFLKKETFFNWNRAYLLITPVLSIILPFVSLGFLQQNIPQEYAIQLPSVIISNSVSEVGSSSTFWFSTLKGLWIVGILISTLIFLLKIVKIIKFQTLGTTAKIQATSIKILPKTDSAFSFYNTIYLGENISDENRASIIAHETVHILQKHSLDLLYFELLRIVFWFNPMVYMFQNRISTLHEYIADAKITQKSGKKEYYQNLLSEVFQTQEISFINTFFKHSLIKKRIIMLQKPKSPQFKLAKYLMLLPILGAMLLYTSCSDTTGNLQKDGQEMMEPPPPPPPPPPPANKWSVELREDVLIEETTDVPYSVIEQVPIYPGCSGDNETMKKCMSTKIAEFINSNFNTGIADDLNLSGLQRISVQFKIDKTGKIVDVLAKAPKRELEMEAIRLVEMLPQMIPGEQKGKKVGVLYSLPIVFNVK